LDWDWKAYPVIRIDLSAADYTKGVQELYNTLSFSLKNQAKKLKIELEASDIITQFKSLICDANEKYGEKVVVLIDEYDKPLLDTLETPDLCKQLRSELKGFYSVLKAFDQYLRFVFLTGVSKFSQVSIFSGLNNIYDLTLDPEYADICGWTEEELLNNFHYHIEAIIEDLSLRGLRSEEGASRGNLNPNETILNSTNSIFRQSYLEQLRRFYNGYRFTEKELKVYNPFGMLNHLQSKGKFQSYWYSTSTPTFLIELITKQKIDITKLNKSAFSYRTFQTFDIESVDAVVVLYQTGYLTISDYIDNPPSFVLDYPNEEVLSSFMGSLSMHYLKTPLISADALYLKLPTALNEGRLEDAIEVLEQFLASVAYDIGHQKEIYYQTVVHIVFNMFGLNCQSEVRIGAGRIDALVQTEKYVYCFEFKVDKSADEALAQIESKRYMQAWEGSGKKLFKVGVNFDTKIRNIGEWKYISE
jgi:hypothetical protein